MGRGPSYPYVGLEDAIGLTRKMYDYTKRTAAPVDSIIKEAWKYSPTSSSSHKALAALKAFGLVEDAPGTNGRAMKITPRAVRILLDDEDSKERKDEIRKAALSPKWYEFCWKQWGKEMPPSMRSNLLVEHGFVENTVGSFLKDYRKTMGYAGLLDDKIFSENEESADQNEPRFKVGDYVQWETQGELRMPKAKRIASFLDDGKFALVEGSNNPMPVAELISADPPEQDVVVPPVPVLRIPIQGDKSMQSETIALAGGLTLQVQWPASITEDAYEDFLYQVEGFKRRIGRAVQKAGATSAEANSASE